MLNVKEFNDYFEKDQDFLAFADGLKVKMFDAISGKDPDGEEVYIPQKVIIVDEPIDERRTIYFDDEVTEEDAMQVIGKIIDEWRK